MNLSGKHLEDPDRQQATPPASSDGAWWRRGLKLGGLVALLSPKKPGREDPSAPPGSRQSPSWARNWIVIVALVLVSIPIAAVLLGYLRRPAAGEPETSSRSLFGDSSAATGAKPKPAAGKPFPPPSEEPPAPVPAPPEPARPAPGNAQTAPPPHNPAPHNPSSPSAGVPAPAPMIPARPPVLPPSPAPTVVPETYPARHDKRFGEGCSGQLTLNASGLEFTCPGDPDETLRAAFNQIASVDDNGIKLTSGKKYHFTIQGMSKDAQRALFRDWFNRAR